MRLFAPGTIVSCQLDGRTSGIGVVLGPAQRELGRVVTQKGVEWHRIYWVSFSNGKARRVSAYWLRSAGLLAEKTP